MTRREPVRLRDIAERLDLSEVSVSKALRDHPDISDATKALVKKTAKEMGYLPNLVARSLSSQQTMTIGVVIPEVAHAFFAAVTDGIHEGAHKNNYEIVLTVSQESAELERRHIETLLAMQVDGLLISVSQEPADLSIYELIEERNVPLVFFDRRIDGLDYSSVTVDDRTGARRAVEYAIDNGYTKIAHLAGYSHVEIGRERRKGYEDALQTHGLPVRDRWIVEGGFGEASGYWGFNELSDRGELPAVVFAVTLPVGLGMYDAMWKIDPGLTDDIEVIAFGNWGTNLFFQQKYFYVGIDQSPRKIGKRAVSLLIEKIQNPNAPKKCEVLPIELITSDDRRDLPYQRDTREAPS